MKAIILSAGLGSRLLPLTADKPKCLVAAGGRTILEHQLIALAQAGIGQVAVVGGYRFDRLTDFVERMDQSIPRPELIFNPFYAVSSSIGSVWAARHLLEGPFCLLNGDTLYERSLIADSLAGMEGGLNLFVEPLIDGQVDDMLVRADLGRVIEVGKSIDPARANYRSLGIVATADADGAGYGAVLQDVIAQPGGDQRFHHDVVDEMARLLRVSALVIEPGQFQEIGSPEDIDRWLGIADSAAA